MQKTTIAKDIDMAQAKAGYDDACKKILSNRVVLAWILKSCTDEFRDCSVSDIAEKYIAGPPEVSAAPVHQDETPDGRILGERNEDTSIKEGTVTFDIRFPARLPGADKLIGLIINLEAQRKYRPGYPLLKRGVYYLGRLVSSQKGTVFEGEHYEKIQKVYSIWICMQPPRTLENTITKYAFREENVIGTVKACTEEYDLMTLIMICLGEPGKAEADILQMLDVLLSDQIRPEAKKKILEQEFHIPMTKEMEGEVRKMCNLSDAIEERALERGKAEGRAEGRAEGHTEGRRESILESIRNLMKNLDLSLEEAMKALDLPEAERQEFQILLEG